LIHLIRQMTAVNIFRESSPRVFAHTTASALLTSPEFFNTSDLILHFIDEGYKCSGYLPEALDLYADKFDKVQKPELRTAFNLAFNTDMHYFDWIYTPENIPRYGERFGRSMMGGARAELIGKMLDTYDWQSFKKGDKIIDVGGGVGHVAVGVAQRAKPGVEVIVQDRPSVVDQGREIHGHIVTLEPHDFFDKQPIKGANVYYLRLILHDWPDSICQTILGNIVPAMNADSKLLIMDLVWKGDDYWANGRDDEDIIDGWSQGKRQMNIRTLHMLNKLGMSSIIKTNSRCQRTYERRVG
jgi:sterigmatocystin 8-O-methyltransferase